MGKITESAWEHSVRQVRFLSGNPFKVAEATFILGAVGVNVKPVAMAIQEIQTTDVEALVRDKCIKAFSKVGFPLFVEHTGLQLEALNGFPNGLTQIFWDTLQADRFCELFGGRPDNKVIASTHVAYCDGKRIHHFAGEINGRVAEKPRGDPSFQWDCVFIPDGFADTFAELGSAVKNSISMRRQALDSFASYITRWP